jgi:hypothetical protein
VGFSIGAGTIAFSILLDPELSTYYRNRRALAQLEAENKRIEDLMAKYQMQIDLIHREPNILRRLEWVTFGKAYRPEAELPPEQLPLYDKHLQETARAVLAEMETEPDQPSLPHWLQRCLQPNIRTALFLAGCGLVIVSFIFFGTPSMAENPSKRDFH